MIKPRWQALDYFESDIYARESVEVTLTSGDAVQAFAYIVLQKHHHLLSDQPWDEATFIQKSLREFMTKARDWMRELDAPA